jgi:multisubunit Na+/H+ antiporter MnhE subunit
MILLVVILLSSMATFGLITDDFTWQNMVVAFVLSIGLMVLFRRQISPDPLPPTRVAYRVILTVPLLLWYLVIDILKGTYQIVTITLGLRPLAKPGIVKVPITVKSHYGVGPVGYFVTLSPGSFLVDLDWDERMMLIHVIDASDPDQVRRDAEKYFRLWQFADDRAPSEVPEEEKRPDA